MVKTKIERLIQVVTATMLAVSIEIPTPSRGQAVPLIDDPNRTSLMKVRGDSMKDVGIFDGDLVVVEHNTPTKPGDTVVACVDDELTVKTLQLDGAGKFFLQPANPAYQPIFPQTSLEVLGLVIGVVRRTRR